MALGETPESTQIILEQKDLSDLTPEDQTKEAKLFIINMHKFMMKQIQELDERPEEKWEFVNSMDELEASFIENHAKINPIVVEVWEALNQRYNIESLATRQIQKIMTPEVKQDLQERAAKRGAFLRVRGMLGDHLDEEGLRVFNLAMEAELDR